MFYHRPSPCQQSQSSTVSQAEHYVKHTCCTSAQNTAQSTCWHCTYLLALYPQEVLQYICDFCGTNPLLAAHKLLVTFCIVNFVQNLLQLQNARHLSTISVVLMDVPRYNGLICDGCILVSTRAHTGNAVAAHADCTYI